MKQCIKCGAVQDDSRPRCNYPNCGGELKEFTTREQAMNWWFFLTLEERFYLVIPWLRSKGLDTTSRHPSSLTDNEIEEIWKQETQLDTIDFEDMKLRQSEFAEEIEDMCNNTETQSIKSQANEVERIAFKNLKVETKVDFKMLQKSLEYFLWDKEVRGYFGTLEVNNIELFFKLLAEKPTFAQLAHKELNKLNK